MSPRDQRRRLVRSLLQDREVQNQSQLLDLLAEAGHPVSQPVLSRDLRALGVAKQEGVYRIPEVDRVTPLSTLRSLLRSTAPVTHLVGVQCEPGAASAVGRALEAEGLEGLEGTIAGDDTVLVFARDRAAVAGIQARIRELLPEDEQ